MASGSWPPFSLSPALTIHSNNSKQGNKLKEVDSSKLKEIDAHCFQVPIHIGNTNVVVKQCPLRPSLFAAKTLAQSLENEANDDLYKDGRSPLIKNFISTTCLHADTKVPKSKLIQDVDLQRLGSTCQASSGHNMSLFRHGGAGK
ncbi:hypothetical protein TB2_018659 [Malus domestica]